DPLLLIRKPHLERAIGHQRQADGANEYGGILAEQAPGARMRRSPARSSSGLARKQRRSINSSARTGTPGTNLKMSTISCWAAPTPGENFIRLGFARRRRTRQSAADAFPRRTLYGYRQGAILVTT